MSILCEVDGLDGLDVLDFGLDGLDGLDKKKGLNSLLNTPQQLR